LSDQAEVDWQAAQEATHYLSGKWVLAVVAELADEPRGHNDLARATGVLDHKPLDRALHRLERAGLVDRTVYDPHHSAPRVHYSLTDKGRSLLPLIQVLASWWRTPPPDGANNS
jgi:DNA-binding HxlR family transcriptional regulator